MMSSCSHRPFCPSAALACGLAAFLLLVPVSLSPARAQGAQTALVSQPNSSGPASSSAAATPGAGNAPVTNQANAPVQDTAATQGAAAQQKGIATRAIEKVKQAAKSASDILNRVPCLPPKGEVRTMGSLPHVANKLISGRPVVIVAFGSSSTQGYGSSAPEFTYPNRLAAQLRRQYPSADISVVNRGVGGEDAPEMMKRLQSVIDVHPDLVIWQVGTNAVLRNLDPDETARMVEDGVSLIQVAGSDVVLVDPQYSPRVTEHPESASRMVRLLGKVAQLRHIGIFPRFEVMREWHERQAIPITDFVIADGLHMNDWGYACFAQLLGDDIIKSVGQIKLGVNVPSNVLTYRPM
jgi:lysophospholipase L1-like esterase